MKGDRRITKNHRLWNINWMICLELNWFIYGPSPMLQVSELLWTLRSSVWVVFNKFLLIDALGRSKISTDHHRWFFAVSLYPLSFIPNTTFNLINYVKDYVVQIAWEESEFDKFQLVLQQAMPMSLFIETTNENKQFSKTKTWISNSAWSANACKSTGCASDLSL